MSLPTDLRSGIFMAPFHNLNENPMSRCSATWSCWSISTG